MRDRRTISSIHEAVKNGLARKNDIVSGRAEPKDRKPQSITVAAV